MAHYKLSLKPEKCRMFVTRVKFCENILTPGGRHRDPEKVAAIERWRWEDITTPTHLRGFLRLTQWYSVYIHDYTRMAAPLQMALQGMCLTKAQKKAQKYQRQTDLLPGTRTRQMADFSKMSQEELVHHYKLQGKIYWTPERKEAFEELEQRFQKEVILQFLISARTGGSLLIPVPTCFGVHWNRRMLTATSAQWHFFQKRYRAQGPKGLTGPTTKLAS